MDAILEVCAKDEQAYKAIQQEGFDIIESNHSLETSNEALKRCIESTMESRQRNRLDVHKAALVHTSILHHTYMNKYISNKLSK